MSIFSYGRWIVFAVVVGVFIAFNVPFQYVNANGGSNAILNTLVDFDCELLPTPRMAGWPYRYSIQYDDSHASLNRFSALALCYNLLIGLISAVLLATYLWSKSRARVNSSNEKRRSFGGVSIADLLLVTLLISLPAAWWRTQTKRQETLAQHTQELRVKGGASVVSIWIPEIVQAYVPAALKNQLREIRGVQLENPTSEDIAKLLTVKNLHTFRVGGGTYDFDQLRGLLRLPHLIDLRIAGRDLEASTMQSLVRLPGLRTLNLCRTNIDVKSLDALSTMTSLRRLGIQETAIACEDFPTDASWCRNLTELRLPTQSKRNQSPVRIENWTHLKKLSMDDLDSPLSGSPIRIELRSLPALETITLSALQCFDLDGRELPRLTTIARSDHAAGSRRSGSESVPGTLWFRKLVLEKAPVLRQLHIHGVDLQTLKLTGCGSLDDFGIGVFSFMGNESRTLSELPDGAAQRIIDGLGECEGPKLVDLDAIPLGPKVDLRPLAKNTQIESLLLANTGTTLDQWKELESLPNLRLLRVKDNPSPKSFDRLISAFPNLRTLQCGTDMNSFASAAGFAPSITVEPTLIRIENHLHLRDFDLGEMQQMLATGLRIINAPELKTPFRIDDFATELTIKNAPQLSALVVNTPLPSNRVVEGLRDIKKLEVGGEHADDEFLECLQSCTDLQSLSLAYAGASPAALARLPVQSLRGLSVPGCRVTDEVLDGWELSERLATIDLSHTDVTGPAVKRMLERCKNLQSIRLNGCKVSPEDLSPMKTQNYLSSLHLAGIGLDMKHLDGWAPSQLGEIDLSGTTVDASLIKTLRKSRGSLRWVGLRDCRVAWEPLIDWMGVTSWLTVDPSGSDLPSKRYAWMIERGQLAERDPQGNRGPSSWPRSSRKISATSSASNLDVFKFDPKSSLNQAMKNGNPTVGSFPNGPPPPQGGWLRSWFGAGAAVESNADGVTLNAELSTNDTEADPTDTDGEQP